MFSPYFAWARRRGKADAEDHAALNVALYGRGASRWSMTERGRASLDRSADTLAIGPSRVLWDGSALRFDIDEIAAPVPRRIRGTVRVTPHALVDRAIAIDASAQHWWTPIAPSARIEVALESPALRWSGEAYVDGNHGAEPLAERIRRWQWSRGHVDGSTVVTYDVTDRDDAELTLALAFDRNGTISTFTPPPRVALPPTLWRIRRAIRSDGVATIEETLEDTPFYARSLVVGRVLGQAAISVHESLDLDRFRAPVVQAMLPFRMPRHTRPKAATR
ncbi:MAG TPA: hypothetical protein VI258_02325 [Rhodanobacteraceae bacterium]